VQVEGIGVARSCVTVRYVHTAISEKGVEFVSSLSQEAFAQKMADWQRLVTAAILRQP
jgi:hypothetical protein